MSTESSDGSTSPTTTGCVAATSACCRRFERRLAEIESTPETLPGLRTSNFPLPPPGTAELQLGTGPKRGLSGSKQCHPCGHLAPAADTAPALSCGSVSCNLANHQRGIPTVSSFITRENPAKPLIRTTSTPNRTDDAMKSSILGCPTSGPRNASIRVSPSLRW